MIRPIFALFIRSIREDNRAKFTPIARAALVLVILFFLAINHRNFARQPAPGLQVFFLVMVINLFGLVLGGITAFCSAITEEKEDDTLGLLRMTNLSPVAILFGKGLSRFVGGMLLIVAQIPFSLLCVTLGGVSGEQILSGYAVLIATLFFLCNLGLLMSVICRKTGVAVALTLFVGTVIYVGGPIAYISTLEFGRSQPSGVWSDVFAYLLANNPLYQLGTMVFGAAGRGMPLTVSPWTFNGIGGVSFFLLAWALFGRFCSGTAETAPRRKKSAKGAKLLRAPRPDGWAIAWKDFWFLQGGRRGLISRFIGYAVLVFGFVGLVTFNNNYMESDDIGEMMMSFAGIGLCVELVLGAARIFGIERRWLTLSSLITIPIPLGSIIRQKILAALASLIPGFCFVVLGAMIAPESLEELWRDITRREESFLAFTYVAIHLISIPLLACWLSLKMRRGAVPATIAIGFVGNVIFAVLLDEVARSSDEAFLLLGIVIQFFLSVALMVSIRKRIALAAAAD
ncbi:MAG: hypothetical protein RL088_3452 [Verrucomicrobiota bacterium]|jgi:hypothetical protein